MKADESTEINPCQTLNVVRIPQTILSEMKSAEEIKEILVAHGFDLQRPIHKKSDIYQGCITYYQRKAREVAAEPMTIDGLREMLRRGV